VRQEAFLDASFFDPLCSGDNARKEDIVFGEVRSSTIELFTT
jgi:hypothetical protein